MRRDLVRCYYASQNSATAAIRLYKKEKKLIDDPCTPQSVSRLIHKFESEFTLHDLPKQGRPSKVEERGDVVEQALANTVNEHGSTSIRRISRESGIPSSSVHRILRNVLSLIPYKLQMLQTLKPEDSVKRLQFAEWVLQHQEIIPNILWTDEAYMHIDGDISQHHCRIWSVTKPLNYLTKPLHPVKTCVWMGFSSQLKLKPFFFDEPLKGVDYLNLLQTHVIPQLTAKRKLSSTVFMHDGAPPHFATSVRDYLISKFGEDRIISRGCQRVWPARSPDLNPLDYWFWGTLKARVFHYDAPRDLDMLKTRIVTEVDKFTKDEIAYAISSFLRRIELLKEVGGSHIEHLL